MTQATNQVNPSLVKDSKAERTRIPMSLPQQKLSVPDIPGYHLHWMNGNPGRISQALAAGYEFVEPGEVEVNNFGLADNAGADGNTDMGTRVSIVSGQDVGQDGQANRLYLMKIRQDWWGEDQAKLEDRNEQIATTLRGGADVGNNPNGSENRYVPESHKKNVAELFTRKSRRS